MRGSLIVKWLNQPTDASLCFSQVPASFVMLFSVAQNALSPAKFIKVNRSFVIIV